MLAPPAAYRRWRPVNEDKHGLTLEELEAETVEQLPDRELMGKTLKVRVHVHVHKIL